MLLAAFGDIHGNLPALEAVLNAVDAEGIEAMVCTGDTVVGFSWPNEVIEVLIKRRIPCVQGEMDRLTATFLKKGRTVRDRWRPAEYVALEWTYGNTRSDNIEFLRGLPRRRLLTYENIELCLCHGVPSSQTDSLYEDDDDTSFRRQRELANVRLIVCGRGHRSFARTIDDALFVNPGSVGMPSDEGAKAGYAVINTESEPWFAETRWIDYDFERAADGLRKAGLHLPRE